MLGMKMSGRSKSPMPMFGMVSGAVLNAGTLICGRVNWPRLIGGMVMDGIVKPERPMDGIVKPERPTGGIVKSERPMDGIVKPERPMDGMLNDPTLMFGMLNPSIKPCLVKPSEAVISNV
jgi:hypothetical protein